MLEFGVIGDPIAQSRSPQLHSWFYKRMKINASTKKIHCNSENLLSLMKSFREGKWKGLNVTIPHKESVIQYLDTIDPGAKEIGAVNCMVNRNGKLHGTNTDKFGFKQMLLENGVDPDGRSCMVIGTGGAGKTAVNVLLEMNVKHVDVWSRSNENAGIFIEKFKDRGLPVSLCSSQDFDDRIKGVSIIVNCTPLGMGSLKELSPVNKDLITEDHILIDCVYNPVETKFLQEGKIAGAKIVNGLDMFIFQGLHTMETWFPEYDWKSLPISDLKKDLLEKGEAGQPA